jgi:hypothetical protein
LLFQRRFQDAAGILNLPPHFVGGHVLDQHKKRGVPRLKACRKLLHELVVDAVVGERATECATRCAKRNADNGIEEQDPDQEPPEAAGGRSRSRRVEKLAESEPA